MALTLLTANNAQTVLAAGISASATSLTVNSGTGALFPAVTSGVSFFKLTLVDAATGQLSEIVHVTARTGDSMTIVRAQEGTTARAWSANDIAANMLTAGTIALLAPLDSPSLTGTPTVPTAAPGTNTTQAASTEFVGAAISAVSGRLLAPPMRLTASGVYNPSPEAKYALVELQAAGGNGGNAPETGSGVVGIGDGGSAGGYAKFLVKIRDITNFNYTVGVHASTSNSATVGGSTSFCGVTCAGGKGGSRYREITRGRCSSSGDRTRVHTATSQLWTGTC